MEANEQKLKKLISDDDLNYVWGNANFGKVSKRHIVKSTLLKCSVGHYSGHTAKCIVHQLGLVYFDNWQLTEKGKEYLYNAYADLTD